MARMLIAGVLSAAVLGGVMWAQAQTRPLPEAPLHAARSDDVTTVRFIAVDVFVDSGAIPLAAYQFEFSAPVGASIVGVEGGETEAFSSPPYYDPEALMQGRIIVGAFHIGDELPSGKTRVARLHLRTAGELDPEFRVELTVAGNADGDAIEATASAARTAS